MFQRLSSRKRGFTAIEIAMVASVIAILALLILPIFRKRAEDARLVAAQDEVQSLVKALLLVEAEMPGGNFLPMLSDLDNRSLVDVNIATVVNDVPDLQPARTKWAQFVSGGFGFVVITDAEWRNSVIPNLQGPYIAQRNTTSLTNIGSVFPEMTNLAPNLGPILVPGAPWTTDSLNSDRYPVDPWGRPYLLFGSEETIYNFRGVYSLGPNGIPGPPANNPTAPVLPGDYNRRPVGARASFLGQGDDISFLF
jgi:prepilin-type N-terminal cleavage/methylation domain-containing protein